MAGQVKGKVVRGAWVGVVLTVAGLSLGFVGCSSGSDGAGDVAPSVDASDLVLDYALESELGCPGASNPESLGVIPEFSSPWAPEFSTLFCYPPSKLPGVGELIREIARDERIDAAELAEVKAGFVLCLEGLGFWGIEVNDDTSLTVGDPEGMSQEEASRLEQRCEVDSGWFRVAMLFNAIRRDPEKLGTSEVMARCFVRGGIREPGYTAEDYEADFDSGAIWEIVSDRLHPDYEIVCMCNDDPQSVG